MTKLNLFVNRAMVLMMPVMMLVMNCISVLIVWVGSKAVDMGNMQVGGMIAFIQYTMQIVMSFLMVSMIFIMAPRAAVAANRIGEVLSTKPVVVDPKQAPNFCPRKKVWWSLKTSPSAILERTTRCLKTSPLSPIPGRPLRLSAAPAAVNPR